MRQPGNAEMSGPGDRLRAVAAAQPHEVVPWVQVEPPMQALVQALVLGLVQAPGLVQA